MGFRVKLVGYGENNAVDWEERKLGEILTESRVKGNTGDVANKMTVKLWGKGIEKKTAQGSACTQYYRRSSGQFIYSKLDFLNSAFGVVPLEMDGYETTLDLPAFDVNNAEAQFIFYKAITKDFYLRKGMIADGSRKAKRVHSQVFLNMQMHFPALKEQQSIVETVKVFL